MQNEAADFTETQGIAAFPTIRFFVSKKMVREIQGADIGAISAAVRELKETAGGGGGFTGAGLKMGGATAGEELLPRPCNIAPSPLSLRHPTRARIAIPCFALF